MAGDLRLGNVQNLAGHDPEPWDLVGCALCGGVD